MNSSTVSSFLAVSSSMAAQAKPLSLSLTVRSDGASFTLSARRLLTFRFHRLFEHCPITLEAGASLRAGRQSSPQLWRLTGGQEAVRRLLNCGSLSK